MEMFLLSCFTGFHYKQSYAILHVHVRCLNVMSAGLTGILAAFIFSKLYGELCTYLLYPIFLSLGLLHICRFYMNIFLSLFGCFVSCLSNWGCWDVWGELASRKRLFNPPSLFSRLGILVPLDYLAYNYMYFCVLLVSFDCEFFYGG